MHPGGPGPRPSQVHKGPGCALVARAQAFPRSARVGFTHVSNADENQGRGSQAFAEVILGTVDREKGAEDS